MGSDDVTAPMSLDTEVLDDSGNAVSIESLAREAYRIFVETGGWSGGHPLAWEDLVEITRRRWRAVVTCIADRLVTNRT